MGEQSLGLLFVFFIVLGIGGSVAFVYYATRYLGFIIKEDYRQSGRALPKVLLSAIPTLILVGCLRSTVISSRNYAKNINCFQ